MIILGAEKSQIGLDSFYYCECVSDGVGGVNYGSPQPIPGIITAEVRSNSSIDTQWADDGPADNVANTGGPETTLNFTNLALSVRAWLLGHTVTSGVVEEKVTDIPKTVAIGFRSMKSNGKYRHVWLLKGNFAKPDDSYATKEGGSTKFGTTTLLFKGLRRDYDKKLALMADEDDPAVPASVITNWFAAVPVSISAPDALTLGTVPTDGAPSVAVSSSMTFTYNNAIKPAFVGGDYFYLLKASDGTKVDAVVSQDSTGKIITLKPDSDLASSGEEYILIASGLIQDVYGQKLAAGMTVVNFTTA